MKWLISILLLTSLQGYAQVVQNFDLTNVVDGNVVSLKNYSSNPAVVIIVTTINCPYTEYYLHRIKILAETYKSKVPVLLINSSSDESESENAMAAFATQNKFTFAYLSDKKQKVFLNLNPSKSPEAFLLQNSSGKFTVVYRGAIDDTPQSEDDVNHAYLQEAIDALLAEQKIPVKEIRPTGCNVRRN
jgi:peroxiredoxin